MEGKQKFEKVPGEHEVTCQSLFSVPQGTTPLWGDARKDLYVNLAELFPERKMDATMTA